MWAIEHPDDLAVTASDTGWHIPSYLTLLLGDTQSGHRVRTQEAKQRRAARKRQRRHEPAEPAAPAVEQGGADQTVNEEVPASATSQSEMQAAAHAEVATTVRRDDAADPDTRATWQWTRHDNLSWQGQWWSDWHGWTPHWQENEYSRVGMARPTTWSRHMAACD